METQQKNLIKVKGYGEIETPESHPLILHFLTPLELATYKNCFKKMIYIIEGIDLVLEPFMCGELFSASRLHIATLRRIIQPARIRLLKKSDPEIRRFLLKPLKHQCLPVRIYEILASNYCRKMEEVALHGECGLRRMRGMGKGNVTYLIKVFIKNGCGSLFL